MKAAASGIRAVPVSAQIIPFPERPHAFDEPCADPATCLSVMELPGSNTLTVVCPRCGLAGVLDHTLAELDPAIAASEASHA